MSKQDAVEDNEDLFQEKVVYSLEATDSLSPEMLKQLKEMSQTDEVLQAIKKAHKSDWGKQCSRLKEKLPKFWSVRHNISMQNDVLIMGDRIIIQEKLKSAVLQKLHNGHQVVQRTKAQARQVVFWPGMSKDIESMASKCSTCQKFQPQNQKQHLQSHDIPNVPWLKLGADIFELQGQSFLVLIDYMTKYPEVLNLRDKSAHSVIQDMKATVARYGIPKEIVSDHVPFASQEMRKFANMWGIKLFYSSPGYPQSNRLAERTVQTVKRVLKKALCSGEDIHLALLSLRNTPVTGLSISSSTNVDGTNSSQYYTMFHQDVATKIFCAGTQENGRSTSSSEKVL